MKSSGGPYVIIDPAFLGDVVFDGPLVAALKRTEPNAQVGIVVRPAAKPIAERIVGVDRVHVFDKRGADRGPSGLIRVARELRLAGYRTALVVHPSPRSALLALAAKIPHRVGFSSDWASRLFLNRTVSRIERTHVGGRLAVTGDDTESEMLAGTIARRRDRSATGKKRVGLALGSEWGTKRWPTRHAVQLMDGLDPERFELVAVGSDDERPLFEPLLSAANSSRIEDRIGGSVADLIEAIESCDLMIGGDTGPLHIARALGVPVVAIFGPTSETRHRFAEHDAVVFVPNLDCRPCSDHGPKRCPLGHHRCMEDLGAARVIEALEEVA